MKKLMNAIKKIAEKKAKAMVVDLLAKNKDKIIKKLNDKIDLPLLSEKDEQELLEGVWETIEEVIVDVSKD